MDAKTVHSAKDNLGMAAYADDSTDGLCNSLKAHSALAALR
jgi:hypothetical protein